MMKKHTVLNVRSNINQLYGILVKRKRKEKKETNGGVSSLPGSDDGSVVKQTNKQKRNGLQGVRKNSREGIQKDMTRTSHEH